VKAFAFIFALLAVCSGSTVRAHDIGVTQAEIVETGAETYRLVTRVSRDTAYLHGGPRLPERCVFDGSPRGVQGPGSQVWVFSCAGGLMAEDLIVLPWRRDGAMISAEWRDGSTGRRLFGNERGVITVVLSELQVGSGSLLNAAGRYVVLGVEHILEGFDHLLFVLGLLLIVAAPWKLVKTITAFTVAHSLTLGLATLGLVNVPGRPVEAAIALSIVFLATEVARGWQGYQGLTHRQPWLVAFAFGLLHGLGFAGALADVGLPQAEIPVALLFFNVGVEIGQLLFIGTVLLVRMGLARLPLNWPAWSGYVPVYLIGTVGAYWLLERAVAMAVPI